MRYPFRQLLASLLIVFMLNTLSWSVNAAAFADWVASEQAMDEVDLADTNSPDSEHPQQVDNHCNNGCHALNLLQGLTATAFVLQSKLPSFVIPQVSAFCPGNTPNSLYRPPRPLALA